MASWADNPSPWRSSPNRSTKRRGNSDGHSAAPKYYFGTSEAYAPPQRGGGRPAAGNLRSTVGQDFTNQRTWRLALQDVAGGHREAGRQRGSRGTEEEEEQVVDNRLALLTKPKESVPIPLSVFDSRVTTLLVRNLSRRVRQEDVMQYWPWDDYQYDLIYVLFDMSKKRGSGRAFINFQRHEKALKFFREWNGKVSMPLSRVDEQGTRRAIGVVAAQRQGFHANVTHWQETLTRDLDPVMMPAIFSAGQRQPWVRNAQYTSEGSREAPPARSVIPL